MNCESHFSVEGHLIRCQRDLHDDDHHWFFAEWDDAEAYVPAPPPPTINEQFMRLKSKFPDATPYGIVGSGSDACYTSYQHEDGTYHLPKHGGFLVWFTLALPKGKFNKDKVWVAFEVPPGFPGAHPKDMYTDKNLRMSYGGYGWRGGQTTNRFYGGPCQWIPVRLQAWNPIRDTLLTYAMVIKRGMESMPTAPAGMDDDY